MVSEGAPPGAAYARPPALGGAMVPINGMQSGAISEKEITDHLSVQALIRAYQVRTGTGCTVLKLWR